MSELSALFNLLLILAALVTVARWIYAITKWDGTKNCDGDCESCPFPPCKDKPNQR